MSCGLTSSVPNEDTQGAAGGDSHGWATSNKLSLMKGTIATRGSGSLYIRSNVSGHLVIQDVENGTACLLRGAKSPPERRLRQAIEFSADRVSLQALTPAMRAAHR